MSKKLAEILANNLDFLKVNNIEKSMGLNKTALVRMIARKEIPEKHQKAVCDWWRKWVIELLRPIIEENNKPDNKNKIETDRNPSEEKNTNREHPLTFEEMMAEAEKLVTSKNK